MTKPNIFLIYDIQCNKIFIECLHNLPLHILTLDNDVMLVENSDFARSNYVFISETLQWHAVCGCSDVWSSASAAVICRAMGFKGGYDSAVAAGGILSRFGHPVQLTCPNQDVQTLSECNINQCNTSMCSLAATVHCSDSVLMKCGGRK